MGPNSINMNIQNIQLRLENIRLKINNFPLIPNELSMSGIEAINIGINILQICLESSQLGMNYNLNLEIQNIDFQLNNLRNNIQKFNLNINPMINPFMPNMMNLQNMNNDNIFNNNINVNVKNLKFETKEGNITMITVPYGTTIKEAIERYFNRMPQVKKEKNLFFIYNGIKLKIDETKIEDYFIHDDPSILVYYDIVIGG